MKTKTLKIRVKDKHRPILKEMASKVNFVWNFVNDLSFRSIKERGVFLSAFDIQKYTSGTSKLLGLHSGTIQEIQEEYTTRRKQHKKRKLRWRVSNPESPKKSLGWIPFKKGTVKWKQGKVQYAGHQFKVWDSYGLDQYEFRSGSFNEDPRGRWYFNVVVYVNPPKSKGEKSIGIDLGLKDYATCSDGTKLEASQFYRKEQEKLAVAQRAKKKKRVRAIHARIKNRRSDSLHKFTRKLVDSSKEIFVGNVSSSTLAKTNMAKSVMDAGWYMLKTMLGYKCDHAGVVFKEVDERYTTQICSDCGSLPSSRPKGIAGLGIREWACDHCGVIHDRDINAARNILAVGHGRLGEGIPVL